MKPLPRGRRKISAQAAADHQRRRVIEAASSLGAEHGYRAMTVPRVAKGATVSASDIYELFHSAEAMRRAVLAEAARDVIDPACDAFDQRRSFTAGVTDALRTLLERITEDRRSAVLCFVTAQQAGPDLMTQRHQTITHAAAALRVGARTAVPDALAEPSPLVCEIAVGGICHIVSERLGAHRADLTTLLPDLTYSLLSLFVAPQRARELAASQRLD